MAELHSESKSLLNFVKAQGKKPYYEISVEEAREVSAQASPLLQGKYDFDGDVSEIFIPSAQVSGGIPAYVYKPKSTGPTPSILVYFHGGGFVIGSRKGVDVLCKTLSTNASCIVVNIEYRLAPEHKHPAAIDDANVATRWVIQNKAKLGGCEESVVGIGGDSAGGKIACSVAHEVEGIGYQVLIYPQVDMANGFPSYKTYAEDYLLTMKLIDWFRDQYVADGQDETDPRISPLRHPEASFKKLPPALFIVAECDPIADDSYAYSKKMKDAGVPNELFLVKGAIHAFYTWPGHFRDCCEEAYSKTVEFIEHQTAHKT